MCSVLFLPVYSLFKCFRSSQMCLVLFLPVQTLLTCFRRLALQTLSLSFLTYNSSSDSKAFLGFIVFSGSPSAVHWLSFSSMQRHGHSHKLTSSRALQHYTVGIPFWTSCKRQSQTSKFDGTTTIPRAPSHTIHITITYVLRRGIQKHCTWRKWLT